MKYLITNIVILVLSLISIYILWLLGLYYFCQKTTQEAKQIINNTILNAYTGLCKLLKGEPQKYIFPVVIGSNGVTICDDVIYTLFKKLDKYFDTWFYLSTDYYTNNVIVYNFNVYNLLATEMNRKLLLINLRHVGEQALLIHLHEQGIFQITNIEDFVAVSYKANRLRFYLALNEQGFSEIETIKRQSY